MKKAITLIVSEEELQQLYCILLDRDAAGALDFLDRHVRTRLRQTMEGG